MKSHRVTLDSRLGVLSAALGCLVVLVAVGDACGDIQTFDTAASVVIGPTQAPGVWYVDRYAPAGFVGGATAPDGRTGTLKHSISSADSSANRLPAFSSSFYNTQGRKYDLPSGTIALSVELYIPSSWSQLNQNVPGAEGRLASLWATAFNGSNAVSAYPIIEFNNQANAGAGGFRVWDSNDPGAWYEVPGFTGYGSWYELAFDYVNGEFRYFINGSLVSAILTPGTEYLGNVILQGYNAGNSYDIFWDNLEYGPTPIPEPSSAAVWAAVGLLAGAVIRFRRQRK